MTRSSVLPSEKEASPPFPALRLWLQERFYRSAALQRLTASAFELRARASLLARDRLSAARGLLRAYKHVEPEIFGGRRRELVHRIVSSCSRHEDRLRPVAENGLLTEYARTGDAQRTRQIYSGFGRFNQARLRFPKSPDDPARQGNLIVLKAHDAGEKGVLLIKYSPAILDFAAVYDLERVAQRYAIVLEPSFWGYQDFRYLLYLGADFRVVIQCQCKADFEFIDGLKSNLVPIRMGPSDWVDPERFGSFSGQDRIHDVAMVAAWSPIKRHEVLFRALARIRRDNGRRLRVALIGYPWDWKLDAVMRLARRHGVVEDCEVFESIPHDQVARILSRSRASVFLSTREGSPKAVHESIFCGAVPIVYRHHKGINLEQIGPNVGLLADDDELPEALLRAIDRFDDFDPAGWARANTGCRNSTATVDALLRRLAETAGERWTRGIATKINAPHLTYGSAEERRDLEPEYRRLEELLNT